MKQTIVAPFLDDDFELELKLCCPTIGRVINFFLNMRPKLFAHRIRLESNELKTKWIIKSSSILLDDSKSKAFFVSGGIAASLCSLMT